MDYHEGALDVSDMLSSSHGTNKTRLNPFEEYVDENIRVRYRFGKGSVNDVDLLRTELEKSENSGRDRSN